MTTLATTVAGIPCLVRVTRWAPGDPGRIYGPPEHCYPPEPDDIDFEVLDRRGRAAPWLERKLDDADIERICAAMHDLSY